MGVVNNQGLMLVKELLKRLWINISDKRKRQLFVLIVLMFIVSIAEVVSIGAVIPFLAALSNPESITQNIVVQNFTGYIGLNKIPDLLLLFTVIFIIAALVSGALRILLLWSQTRRAHAIGADLSYQIFERTLYQPYIIHVNRNSSEVIAGVSAKADQVVSGAVMPLLVITSSFVMLFMVLIALIAIDPMMALTIMFSFVLIYSVFVVLTKKKLYENSLHITKKTNLVIKVLQEGLGGIRDILIDGLQPLFCKTYQSADLIRRRAIASNVFMGQSPRYIVEPLGITMIASVAYYHAGSDSGLLGTLPLLGAIAIGVQRMLPVMQQGYGAWSSIRGAQEILQDALVLLEQPISKSIKIPDCDAVKFQNSITLESLSYRYADDMQWVLKDLQLEIKKGDVIGLIGSTGCGKSTILDVVMGLLTPTKGKLIVDGVEIRNSNVCGWQSHISHIPQNIFLSDTTVVENIAFGVPKRSIDPVRVREVAKIAQIDDVILKLEKQYDTMIGERGIRLSGGQRQRIGIARALYKESDILVLDEATSALDNTTEVAVMNAINNFSSAMTVLIVAHRISSLKNCDYIIELDGGNIKRIVPYLEIK